MTKIEPCLVAQTLPSTLLKGEWKRRNGVWEGKGEIKGEYYAHGEEVYQSSLKPGGGSSVVELFTVLQGCYFAQHIHRCLDVTKSNMPLNPQLIVLHTLRL